MLTLLDVNHSIPFLLHWSPSVVSKFNTVQNQGIHKTCTVPALYFYIFITLLEHTACRISTAISYFGLLMNVDLMDKAANVVLCVHHGWLATGSKRTIWEFQFEIYLRYWSFLFCFVVFLTPLMAFVWSIHF